MDISNKTLAVLLVAAIIISVGGAMINIAKLSELTKIMPAISMITGFGTTGTGYVNVSIATVASVSVTQTNVDFGVGYVTSPNTAAELNSSEGVPGNWTESGNTWDAKDISLYNDGTVDINLTLASNKNGDSMIGGSDPYIQFDAYDNQSSSCSDFLANLTTFTTANVGYEICGNLSFVDSKRSLNVSIVINIPQDAPVGNKTDTLTFTATQRT